MPPILALWGTLLLIVLAFRRDSRNNPYPSRILWLPTAWLMRCGSRNIDYWIGGGESGRWDPVLIAALIVCGVIVLVKRRFEWRQIFASNSATFVFYLYIVASLFWAASAIDNPAIKILRPLGDLIMALVVVTELDPRIAIETMFRRTSILLIPLSIVLIKYFPSLGRAQDKHWGTDSWVGVTTHKNPLGQLCMVSLLAWIWTLGDIRKVKGTLSGQWMAWIYLVMTLYLFLWGGSNSRSSTAIFCFGFFLFLYVAFGFMRNRIQMVIRRIITGAIVLLAAALVLQLSGTSLQAIVAESFGKNPTLTDRTYLWSDIIRLGMKNPILGSGYGAFWVPSIYTHLSTIVDNRPEEAHNGYLETYANLGLLGVALLLWIILQSIKSAANTMATDFDYGRIRLALILTVAVMNYSEAAFPRGNHLWWYGFLIVALYAQPPKENILTAQNELSDVDAD